MQITDDFPPGGFPPDRFLALAARVYQDDPVWVPQSQNSFLQTLARARAPGGPYFCPLLCEQDGQPLARAAALLVEGAVDEAGRRVGYVAFFECLPGAPEAGRMALTRCEELLRAQGAEVVQAPRVDNLNLGLQVSGFDLPQTVLTAHNPPYYLDLLTSAGYAARERLQTYLFSRDGLPPIRFALPGYRTRTFDRAQLESETRALNALQTEIFHGHPGYVPRTLEEDRQMIEAFLPLLDDELVILAEDAQGRPVGLLICLPDAYQAYKGRPVDTARLISIGVVPRCAHKGLGVLMGLHLARNLIAKGYQTLEGSWIREDNAPPHNLARRFKGKPGREFVLMEKRL